MGREDARKRICFPLGIIGDSSYAVARSLRECNHNDESVPMCDSFINLANSGFHYLVRCFNKFVSREKKLHLHFWATEYP